MRGGGGGGAGTTAGRAGRAWATPSATADKIAHESETPSL
jgi:hypothetical protein